MIDEELLSKWDCMQDLPISEEQLGAYMEGGCQVAKTSNWATSLPVLTD